MHPKGTQNLVNAVLELFDAVDPHKLDDTFLVYQKVLKIAMFVKGGNDFTYLHLFKESHSRNGEDVEIIHRDKDIYNA